MSLGRDEKTLRQFNKDARRLAALWMIDIKSRFRASFIEMRNSCIVKVPNLCDKT